MITPERAPVKPRVKRKGGDAAYLLEDEIAELVQQGWRGVVLLGGGPGSGKSTALRHLSAVLPPECAVQLVDSDEADAPLRGDVAAAFLSKHAIVLTTMLLAVKPALELELVPWDQDEWIEFLLSCHPEQCKSVMARLRAGEECRGANYSAEIWRVVLEEMVVDATVASPLDAMVCRLSRLLTPRQQQALSELALEALPLPDDMTSAQAAEDLAKLDKTTWRMLRQPPVFHWIAAVAARDRIRAGTQQCARCLIEIGIPARGFLYSLAMLIRGEVRSAQHLLRVAQSGDSECHAAAVSVLHLAGALPAPAKGMRPVGDVPSRGRIQGPYLRGAILEGVQWPGALLADMEMQAADLTLAKLCGAVLDRAVATKTDFSGADLREVSLTEAQLNSSQLGGTDLSRATGNRASFTCAHCINALFKDSNVFEADFRAANLSGAIFQNAQLVGARLTGAVIDGADFSGANLSRAFLDGLPLHAAGFRSAGFMCASLKSCVFDGMDLPQADCEAADFTNATFTAASMRGANLRGANLRGCGLADVDWERADLRYADLRGAVFSMGGSRSGLVGSPYPSHGTRTGFYTDDFADLSTHKHPEEIRKANLCGADLRGANIEGVDFYLVDLRGALYDAGQAEQLRRCGAILREPVA